MTGNIALGLRTVAVSLAVLVVLILAGRAADDAARPKLVLVEAEWSCRRSHPELDARPEPNPDGSAGRTITPVLVCDSWSRR